ncbi:hypothetical protein O1D37_003653 [Vibrio cholerae]|uniref:hypothetical protein n=1 Tax=Vibrio cholerae TaxID=666 RepID=UPI001D4B201A|nr:hypothetical protein [Vibrio cholerae]EGS7961858.1 hypothetical protein [Vibrio cholerae]EJL6633842.1 hypothetical protein [Vibrio cholerae]EJO4004666.1 hypothetical protein [Vibrio cholerae]EKF9835921.1 hypothetical protein [Vibrio cholerae]
MKSKGKMIEIIFDRLVIGSIVGLAVYFSTVQLEKNKADEAFNIAVNQMRVQKIAEVWEEAALFEAGFDEFYFSVDDAKFEIEFLGSNKATKEGVYKQEDVVKAAEKLEIARQRFLSKIRINRFYLGKPLEEQVINYYQKLANLDALQKLSLSAAYETDEYEKLLKESRVELASFRTDIDQIRLYFIDGGR